MLEKSERRTNRLSISARDLEQSIRFMTELSSLDGEIGTISKGTVHEALLLSAIVSYARPFSHNEIEAIAKANAKITEDVLVRLSDEERALHKKIVSLRNRAIAHSEWSLNPTRLSEQGVFIGKEFTIWSKLCDNEIRQFKKLIEKILNQVQHLRASCARQ